MHKYLGLFFVSYLFVIHPTNEIVIVTTSTRLARYYTRSDSIFGPVGTREPSPTALALGFNVSRIYFACCKYAGNLYPAYLQHAFVYCMMIPKAKAIGLVSIVPVGRKDIQYYINSESLLPSFPIVMGKVPRFYHPLVTK